MNSNSGSADIVIENKNPYWTNLEVSRLGVTLTPGPTLSGGLYASSGVLGPNASATWRVQYDSSKPAQVFVRCTPYLLQTKTGGLAAALNILNIAASMLGSYPATLLISSPQIITDAADIVESLMGDDLATKFTIKALVSGDIGRAIWTLLNDANKRAVLAEALKLVGVDVTADRLANLSRLPGLVKLLTLTADMGADILFGQSAGGVLFDSVGSATPPAVSPPAGSPPRNSPPVVTPAEPNVPPPLEGSPPVLSQPSNRPPADTSTPPDSLPAEPAVSPITGLDRSSGPPGSTITGGGGGFYPDRNVVVSIAGAGGSGTIDTYTTDSSGRFEFSFSLSDTYPEGDLTIIYRQEPDVEASDVFYVTACDGCPIPAG